MSIPTDLSGLVLWCDASTLGLSLGAPVSSMTDLSGNGHTMAPIATAPTFRPAARRGLGALDFASGATMQAAFTLTQPFTFFAAYRYLAGDGPVAFDGFNANTAYLTTSHFTQFMYGGSAEPTAVSMNGWWVTSIGVYDGASSSITINGITTSFSLGTPAAVPGGMTVGANGGGSYPAHIHGGEWGAYSRALSAPDIATLQAYLNRWIEPPTSKKLIFNVGADVGFRQAVVYDGSKIRQSGYDLTHGTPYAAGSCNADLSGPAHVTGDIFSGTFDMDPQYTGIAIDSSGREVRAGFDLIGTEKMVVARFLTSGTLDSGFGTAGKAVVAFSGGSGAWAYAALITPDGKIVAGGGDQQSGAFQSSGVCHFAVARFNTNGTLDSGFGTGGMVSLGLSGAFDHITGLAVDPVTGKLVVSGMAGGSTAAAGTVALARFNSDGSLDTTFGGGGTGWVVTSTVLNRDRSHAIGVQPDGKVVVSCTENNFAVARFNTNGTLDATFGTAGLATLIFGTDIEAAFALTILGSGKIVVGGYAHYNLSEYNFAAARLNADGTPDTTFGEYGQVMTDLGTDDDEGFAIAQVGSNVAVGGFTHTGNARYDFALVLYDDAGNPVAPASSARPWAFLTQPGTLGTGVY